MTEKIIFGQKKIFFCTGFWPNFFFSPILAPFLPYAFSAKVSQKSGKKWTFLGKNSQIFFFRQKWLKKGFLAKQIFLYRILTEKIIFSAPFWPQSYLMHFQPKSATIRQSSPKWPKPDPKCFRLAQNRPKIAQNSSKQVLNGSGQVLNGSGQVLKAPNRAT